MKKKNFKQNIFAIFFITLMIASLIGISYVPATHLDNRGVGTQIRPANQIDLSSFGNGEYEPYLGSMYSSWSWFWQN